MNCRHCGESLSHSFLELGFAPPSNAYLTESDLSKPEKYYPLKILVCSHCWLVQTDDYTQADELFSPDYAYFSSTSSSWLEHASNYAKMMIRNQSLDQNSMVIEVASNDGYLLKNFVDAGIPCLGIEPTNSTAEAAEKLGIPVIRKFFGENLGQQLAIEGNQADLIIGNNVYAHVPDINDFTRGLKSVLKPGGTITLEFPHLMRLIENNQFDTVYHEHFSYLSLAAVSRIFKAAKLRIYRVEELQTHGGSLRVYGCHTDDPRPIDSSLSNVLKKEEQEGLEKLETYLSFQPKAERVKNDLLKFLINQKEEGKCVVAYGAAAKGNTLLNYAGVKPDVLSFVFDAAPSKQNKYMPGSHIPILSPDRIIKENPDYVLILPWNLAGEVIEQLQTKLDSTRFVVAVPNLRVI